MRIVLHLVCIVLVLPYLALASAFLVLGHVIISGSLWGMFDTLVSDAAWFVPWGAILIGALVILVAALGFSPRYRGAAAALVFLVAAASLVVIVVLSSGRIGFGEFLFLVPCIGALAGAGWLAASERRSRDAVPRAA